MHVEKNVCDIIIGTLLNIKGKTKDGINARKDLVEMGVRLELQPQPHGKRTYLPPACHTLSKSEKIGFCNCLRGVKVPQGYSSNIKSLVLMEDLKLMWLLRHALDEDHSRSPYHQLLGTGMKVFKLDKIMMSI